MQMQARSGNLYWKFFEEKECSISFCDALQASAQTMLRHARLQIEYKGDFTGIREMRKHVAWYTKGLHGAARLRDRINQVESYAELENLLTSL